MTLIKANILVHLRIYVSWSLLAKIYHKMNDIIDRIASEIDF